MFVVSNLISNALGHVYQTACQITDLRSASLDRSNSSMKRLIERSKFEYKPFRCIANLAMLFEVVFKRKFKLEILA